MRNCWQKLTMRWSKFNLIEMPTLIQKHLHSEIDKEDYNRLSITITIPTKAMRKRTDTDIRMLKKRGIRQRDALK